MATPAERKALAFLAAIAALGMAVRGWRAGRERRADAAGVAALARQITAVDSATTVAAQRRRAKAAPDLPAASSARPMPPAFPRSSARPSIQPQPAERPPQRPRPTRPTRPTRPARQAAPVTPVDVDEAGADEIATIPGIGPVLAARIVEDRRRQGPFGSLTGLQRVKGIGPGIAGRIARYVRFSHPLASPPTVIELPRVRRRAKSP